MQMMVSHQGEEQGQNSCAGLLLLFCMSQEQQGGLCGYDTVSKG
jgi:hypothetical protein